MFDLAFVVCYKSFALHMSESRNNRLSPAASFVIMRPQSSMKMMR